MKAYPSMTARFSKKQKQGSILRSFFSVKGLIAAAIVIILCFTYLYIHSVKDGVMPAKHRAGNVPHSQVHESYNPGPTLGVDSVTIGKSPPKSSEINFQHAADKVMDDLVDSWKDPGQRGSHTTHHMTMLHRALQRHPFNRLTDQQRQDFRMEDYIEFVQNSSECRGRGKPVFTSMANVFSDLYWQM